MTARVCGHPGCGTHLSMYRPHDDRCARHTPTKTRWEDWLPRWMDDAACAGVGVSAFDVEYPSTGRMTGTVLRAKTICYGCPVADRCVDFAFVNETMMAAALVWGGLTARERKAISRRPDRVQRAAAIRVQQGLIWGMGRDDDDAAGAA